MRLRYDGPYDAVDTEDGQTVERGEAADFSDELGPRLREQDVWTEVDENGDEIPEDVRRIFVVQHDDPDESTGDSDPDNTPEG